MSDIHIEYSESPQSKFSLLDDMWVERGTKADWDQLHDLHYKAETLPPGPHFWRCVTGSGDLVGVTVLNGVTLMLSVRHEVFPNLRPGQDTKFTNVQRAVWLNENLRRAGRIVSHPIYRGLGISYRMVNLAMRMEGYRFVEILSSMSKFNPFDSKAGFRHAKLRPSAAYKHGVEFFRKYFESHPADHESVLNELRSYPDAMQRSIIKDMQKFYFRFSAKEKTGGNKDVGMRKVLEKSDSLLLKEIQQLVLATPAYGVWENPDLNRGLPDRLPLRAFDWQTPNEPLNLEKLNDFND